MARNPLEGMSRPYRPGPLLPQGRLTGPMPWVIAIMMFLTVLATAAGLALNQGARALVDEVSGRVTVQVAEADPQARGQAVRRIVGLLDQAEDVGTVHVVPESELAAQLAPWLGNDLKLADVPLPALIDAELLTPESARTERLAVLDKAVKEINLHARVEPHGDYLSPLAQLVWSIGLVAFAVVALMAFATGAVVVLAARGAHATHRGTIDIMHMLGATDAQVVRLFQRRMMLDALFGGVVGYAAATLVIILVGRSMAAVASDLMSSASLPGIAWIIFPLLPVAGVGVASLSARLTLRRALERSL
ncbi:cell division transport system permease protein [Sphingobium sp. B1D7B]|uniref:cell division protein FtsX n=1 Tax=unclassified Sphingobium TaxID=2611147 RepID=UPI002224A795|nr:MULTISPECIES: FtsX-like permease family protein [unclassified Sphingobium]MCW2392077.1 cell division transport system permease protein [Sphingobium sp. B11D3A]MCW2403784.1 cell division transport system permease protein [Sphingobium sp. B1D7B]